MGVSNSDVRINTAHDPSTPDENLANFGPVTLVLQAGAWRVCRAGYTLPRISSIM